MTSLVPATGTDPQPQSGTTLIESDTVPMVVDESGFRPPTLQIFTGKSPQHVEFRRADTSKTYRCEIVKKGFKTQHFVLDDSTPTFLWPEKGESVPEGEYKVHIVLPVEGGHRGVVVGDAGTIHVGS